MQLTAYPRSHFMQTNWNYNIASGYSTHYPLIMYDEGLGAPTAFKAHPENAAHVDTESPNCYPQSRVNKISATFTFSLMPAVELTDGLHYATVGILPYFLAFKEDYTANDELSGIDIESILHLLRDATDRQGYPSWSAVDMPSSDDSLLGASVPALTASQAIESTGFVEQPYFEAKRHYTNAGKLQAVAPKLFWRTVFRGRQTKFKINIVNRRVKRMNAYAACGVIIFTPAVASHQQAYDSGEWTAGDHIHCQATAAYNEWNDTFNMDMV